MPRPSDAFGTPDQHQVVSVAWQRRQGIEVVEDRCLEASEPTLTYENIKTFAKKLEQFHTYIDNNSPMIPNYGEKWRYSENYYHGICGVYG
jgi:hypothetical protein